MQPTVKIPDLSLGLAKRDPSLMILPSRLHPPTEDIAGVDKSIVGASPPYIYRRPIGHRRRYGLLVKILSGQVGEISSEGSVTRRGFQDQIPIENITIIPAQSGFEAMANPNDLMTWNRRARPASDE